MTMSPKSRPRFQVRRVVAALIVRDGKLREDVAPGQAIRSH